MKKIITFGEIMMRLSPPHFQKIIQSNLMNITFGGGEANVTATLAQWGIPSTHITCFPDNELGKSANAFYQKLGVDMSHTIFEGNRLGLYFLEIGAAMRASQVIYDRAESAFAHLKPEWFNWEAILEDAQWFHWTGITPAISENAAVACRQAIQSARKLGLTVSGDLNFRRNLWQYGKTAQTVMPELTSMCDVVVCAESDAKDCLDILPDAKAENSFISIASQLMQSYPQVKKIITTRRETLSASHNQLKGVLFDGVNFLESQIIDIEPIIDRIGGGDAFMAGFIYGTLQHQNNQKALEFATAASALKHTIVDDINLTSVAEIEEVMKGNVFGRLLR